MIEKHMHSAFPRYRSGFNLIEAAIVLAVVGLVIGGIWVAAAAVNDHFKWTNTEKGWLYYSNIITKNYTAQNSAALPTATDDIQDWLTGSFPLPAGWSCCDSNLAPIDPYGNIFMAQVNTTGSVYLGYASTSLPQGLCIKLQRMIWLKIGRLYPISYTDSPASCATDISTCCTGAGGLSARAYFKLPQR